jgi:DNA topoisomerase-1
MANAKVRTQPIRAKRKKLSKPIQLTYVQTKDLSLIRKRRGKGFCYLDADGKPVSKLDQNRIEAMVLPPAWEDVRICVHAHGHLQAIGMDQKGRKQYIYHPEWRKHRELKKFDRLAKFAEALPKIRKTLDRHLSLSGFPRRKILAAAVSVLQKTNMRVGNEIYTKTNKSFGLTTLRNHHAKVYGQRIHFHYRAKGGKVRDITLTDAKLSRILRHCQELPGQDLFGYKDSNGEVHDITSSNLNRYICRISEGNFSAKDFRTWCGTTHALSLFREIGAAEELKDREWRKRHLQVIRQTAAYLGNTPSICEKYYIHPQLFVLDRESKLHAPRKRPRLRGLNELECSTLTFLRDCK